MKSMYDLQQLLKRYGIFVYTGNRKSDLLLIDLEIGELFRSHLITKEEYVRAKQILQKELAEEGGK